MLENLRSLFVRAEGQPTTPPQREALLDLMIWTMYADGKLAVAERAKIDELEASEGWSTAMPARQYVNGSLAKVREALQDKGKAEKLLQSINARLGSDAMRRIAYDACCDLAQNDGEVPDPEGALLERIRVAFRLSAHG